MDNVMFNTWIPVTEREPEAFESVLLTANVRGIDGAYLVYEGVKGAEGYELSGVHDSSKYTVTAWMPLPEPYEGALND